MNTGAERIQRRAAASLERGLDLAMRVIPVGVLIAIGAVFTAEETVRPHHRAIKAAVFLGLMAFMLRFDMVNSVYLFTLLFMFPTGISLASSNSVLMTVIPMVWAIRAASTKVRLIRPTALDAPIGLFVLAYVLSFVNVDSNYHLVMGLKVFWRQLACCAFFYMITNFVDSAEKLNRLLKILAVALTLIMLTAVVETVAPGTVIIPGWISMKHTLEEGGRLAARVQKMRVGGALASDANIADFGCYILPLMAYFSWKARNPAEKAFWSLASLLTLGSILSTGNRGGLVGTGIVIMYGIFLFRKKLSFRRLSGMLLVLSLLIFSLTWMLDKYTYATNPIDRLLHTQMVGMVPETRTMTWRPSIEKSMEHPFFGFGPYFDIGEGLTFQFWPHNGYLFYLQTLGLFGLGAFLWIMFRVFRMTLVHRAWKRESHPLGDIMALLHVWFVAMAVLQLRSDHQRDDIYPYLLWFLFAVVVAVDRMLRLQAGAVAGAAGPLPGEGRERGRPRPAP